MHFPVPCISRVNPCNNKRKDLIMKLRLARDILRNSTGQNLLHGQPMSDTAQVSPGGKTHVLQFSPGAAQTVLPQSEQLGVKRSF